MSGFEEIHPPEGVESVLTVLYWFYAYPLRAIGLSDLADETGVSKSSARNAVVELRARGFVEIEEIGPVWRVHAHASRPFFEEKIAYNLNLIYRSNLVMEIESRYPNARAIVLFGSHRLGEDTEESDLDIAVEVTSNDPVRIESLGVIQGFGFRKDVPVNVTVFSRNHVDLNLFNNIANGIVLSGFLEARP